jgi:superfamily II DNA/RNA helicase
MSAWRRSSTCPSTSLRKDPVKTTFVIYDEIDQMLGSRSFSLQISDLGMCTATYQPSVMKGWKSVIGFSGTINDTTSGELRAELKDALIITIPSLRKDEQEHRVVKVIKQVEETPCNEVLLRVK